MATFSAKASMMQIDIGDITPANIEQLKTININTLPGKYKCKFQKWALLKMLCCENPLTLSSLFCPLSMLLATTYNLKLTNISPFSLILRSMDPIFDFTHVLLTTPQIGNQFPKSFPSFSALFCQIL